jgi:hypothetical protein
MAGPFGCVPRLITRPSPPMKRRKTRAWQTMQMQTEVARRQRKFLFYETKRVSNKHETIMLHLCVYDITTHRDNNSKICVSARAFFPNLIVLFVAYGASFVCVREAS